MKKHLPYFILAFVIPVIGMLWWWGLFSSTTLSTGNYGDYRYAYIEATGVYSKLVKTQNEVLFELTQQGIPHGAEITLIMSDPRTTPHDQLQAQTGFMIDAAATPKHPLKVGVIPKREVIVAEIKAHPLLAYGKAYSALIDYTKTRHETLHLPTLEIFDHSVLRVEMPVNPPEGAQ